MRKVNLSKLGDNNLPMDCENCGKEFLGKENVKTAVINEQIKLEEWRIFCPHCNDWSMHVRYDHPRLRRFKAKVEAAKVAYQRNRNDKTWKAYRNAQTRYQAEWDRFHKLFRSSRGTESPTFILTEQRKKKKKGRRK